MYLATFYPAVIPFLPWWTVCPQTVSQNKPSSLELHSPTRCTVGQEESHREAPAGADVKSSWPPLIPPAQTHYRSFPLLCWAPCQHILGTGSLFPQVFKQLPCLQGVPSSIFTTCTSWLKATLLPLLWLIPILLHPLPNFPNPSPMLLLTTWSYHGSYLPHPLSLDPS